MSVRHGTTVLDTSAALLLLGDCGFPFLFSWEQKVKADYLAEDLKGKTKFSKLISNIIQQCYYSHFLS